MEFAHPTYLISYSSPTIHHFPLKIIANLNIFLYFCASILHGAPTVSRRSTDGQPAVKADDKPLSGSFRPEKWLRIVQQILYYIFIYNILFNLTESMAQIVTHPLSSRFVAKPTVKTPVTSTCATANYFTALAKKPTKRISLPSRSTTLPPSLLPILIWLSTTALPKPKLNSQSNSKPLTTSPPTANPTKLPGHGSSTPSNTTTNSLIRFAKIPTRLFYCGKLFCVETFAFGAITLDSGVVAETSHRMTPIFIFNTLPLCVFAAAELAFLTPETDVR